MPDKRRKAYFRDIAPFPDLSHSSVLPVVRGDAVTARTVAQDTQRAGEALVASLVAQIDGRPVENMMLPPQLLVRESCGGWATNEPPRVP